MNPLDHYLEDVKKYLPWQGQDDILAELRTNLEAQLEDKCVQWIHLLQTLDKRDPYLPGTVRIHCVSNQRRPNFLKFRSALVVCGANERNSN